jgi:hypothetical protein
MKLAFPGAKNYSVFILAGLLALSQYYPAQARTKTGRTAAELEHPQTWGETSEENGGNQGNTRGAQNTAPAESVTGQSRPWAQDSEGAGTATGPDKAEHTLGASETMDRLFPMGTPTPEKDGLSKEIKLWIHDLGGESHQRQHAVEQLSQTGNRAVPFLLQALQDPYAYTRIGALAALANIREKSAVPTIERLLKDRSYEVRAEAAKSLGIMRSRSSLSKLSECLEDREARVRREGVIAIGRLKMADARDLLISALQTTTHLDVRQQAVQELSSFPSPETVEALLHCTHGQDLKLCIFAIRSLGEIGDPAARPRLVELSHHRDRAIREEAVNAIKGLE